MIVASLHEGLKKTMRARVDSLSNSDWTHTPFLGMESRVLRDERVCLGRKMKQPAGFAKLKAVCEDERRRPIVGVE